MTNARKLNSHDVEIVDYNPQWTEIFSAERDVLLAITKEHFIALEHVGSTAIPGQRAKPIIDMMAAVHSLNELDTFLPELSNYGYQLIETDMPNRHLLRRQVGSSQTFHLHIVELSTWDECNERLMRDYLLKNPQEVKAYGELKDELANTYAEDSLTYTKAKTRFIQSVVDKARDELGLPRIDVWED